MQGHGRCFKLFLALALLLLQYAQGGEVNHSHRDTNVTIRCIERERQALLAFKWGMVDKSDLLSSWGSEAQKQDCCRWVGVSCSNQTGHVLQLGLSYEVVGEFDNFQGKMINPKLIELHHLQHLALPEINFTGSQFPYFIGSLTNLRYLDLSFTNFGGKFPSQVGNLTNLEYLDLGWNRFTGQVENLNWLPFLLSLRYLDLSFANLSNVFDWPEAVNKLPKLTKLTLRYCDLPSPILSTLSYINSSNSLARVDLGLNHLSTSIFLWLSNYNTSLVHLDLSFNQLAGSIPDVFGHMSSLAYLYLSYNQLEGSLPDQLTNLSSLEGLYLSDNQLSGVLSGTHFSKLSKLQYLDLSSNSLVLDIHADWIPPFQLYNIYLESCKMGQHFPKWLQTQKNILYLDLSSNNLEGLIPSFLSKALHLDLSSNKLEGPIPSVISNASYLDLSSNKLEGPIPSVLSKAVYLDLSSNKLEGPIPSVLSKAIYLDLSSNKLEGPIPSVLSNASHLDLSNNKLSGSISFLCSTATWYKKICNYAPITTIGLVFLNLSSNNVSGQVPDCLTHLENLVMLDLSYNALSGKIPTTIGSVFRIETLKLRSNRFVGQLPSSLKNCTSLVVIDVGDNKLSGPIPEWLGVSLKNLVILMLSSNHFNGSLPSQLCHLIRIQNLDFSMNNITRSIPKCLNNLIALA
ncbi:unnamed protein product [Prunus brigantina]